MSISILNRGASGGMTASIIVKGLGEADTVTASNGSKTKNGVWNATENHHKINGIKDLGLWTVTATNGVDTKTQDVLIEVIGLYEIEMFYRLYLYRDGDQCEDVTGGWVKTTAGDFYGYKFLGTVRFNDDNIYVAVDPSGSSQVLPFANTVNKIDISQYTKIKVEYANATCGKNDPERMARLCLASSVGVASWQNYNVLDDSIELAVGNGTLELDISSVSDPVFVVITASADHGISANIKKVWLE